jgi:hypothetical protein
MSLNIKLTLAEKIGKYEGFYTASELANLTGYHRCYLVKYLGENNYPWLMVEVNNRLNKVFCTIKAHKKKFPIRRYRSETTS